MVQERKRLGSILVEAELINDQQLKQALDLQKEGKNRERLGDVMISLGFVTESDLCEALSVQMSVPIVELSKIHIDPRAIAAVPEQWASRHEIVPVNIKNGVITIAMADPTNTRALDDIKSVTSCRVEPSISLQSDVRAAIKKYYAPAAADQAAKKAGYAAGKPISNLAASATGTASRTSTGAAAGYQAPSAESATRTVDVMLTDAVKARASDIILLPQLNGVHIKYRIDGIFRDISVLPGHLQATIVSRIKVLSGLDVTEKRRPQDGRARITDAGRQIDMRVAIVPSLYGETAVIRVLEQVSSLQGLDYLGFRKGQLADVKSNIARPQGMVLVTGPTGSGKTSTLYSMIREIVSPEINIVTLEDPVEYDLPGIIQVQTDDRVGLTFAKGLKAMLRMAPNVVLVGEIRDFETSQIAFQAGLTGHLVLSTLHTNDAVSTVSRLLSMGVEPYLIATSMSCIIAQRLVRKICPNCKRELGASHHIQQALKIKDVGDKKLWGGIGCSECKGTGYKGRTGLYEVMNLDDELRELILDGASEQVIESTARSKGMRSLREEGLDKAFAGITTLEEIARVTDLKEAGQRWCFNCGNELDSSEAVCPNCGEEQKTHSCPSCHKKIHPDWKVCPYCRKVLEL